jgi:hypothetical protein
MRKRILALISASALVALAFGAVPRTAQATTSYDFFIAVGGNTDDSLAAYNTSCRNPYSHDLQDALDDLDEHVGDDSIYLCAGTYYGQFDGDPTSGQDLTIVGASAATTIIDGENDGDETLGFYDGNLTVKNLTFRNGYGEGYSGSAIIVDNGDFTCVNSTFIDNEADYSGGAVYVENGSAYLSKCTFKNNIAGDSGGALYVGDSVNDFGGVYINNGADGDGGAIEIEGSEDDQSTFTKSTFIGNTTCYVTCDGGPRVNGGAIHVNHHSDEALYVHSSKFTNNSTEDWGGAIAANAQIYIDKSSFIGNEAFDGGAIWAGPDAYLDLTSNIFKANRAGEYGGALYVRAYLDLGVGNTFSKNTAVSRSSSYRSDGAFIEDCDSFDTEDFSTPNFAHGTLTSSYGYWLNDVFRNGAQTFYYTDNCSID